MLTVSRTAEELKNSLKLAASVECSAMTGDSVENAFESAVKALWERDAKLVCPLYVHLGRLFR